MSRIPFYRPRSSYLDTELDRPDWPGPRQIHVEYTYTVDEVCDIDVTGDDGERIDLTKDEERDLIEEIWDDVRQNEEGPY